MAFSVRGQLNSLHRGLFRNCQAIQRSALDTKLTRRTYATKDTEDDVDKPVKYTTSPANYSSARSFRQATSQDDTPFAQSISLMLSLLAFLVYFGILREENDLDDLIYADIYDKVPDLREVEKMMIARKPGRREAS